MKGYFYLKLGQNATAGSSSFGASLRALFFFFFFFISIDEVLCGVFLRSVNNVFSFSVIEIVINLGTYSFVITTKNPYAL